MKYFRTLNGFNTFVKKNGTPDTVKIGNETFTQNMYDYNGVYVDYDNGKTDENFLTLQVKTSNRYSHTKFKDAVSEIY